jgi:hypothetical protein
MSTNTLPPSLTRASSRDPQPPLQAGLHYARCPSSLSPTDLIHGLPEGEREDFLADPDLQLDAVAG